jgi:hypothetical protein
MVMVEEPGAGEKGLVLNVDYGAREGEGECIHT